jgi:hypothetical protein
VDGCRNAPEHFRVVKEMDRLTGGTAGAIRLSGNLKAPPNLLGWKAGAKIILGDDWQVGPDAKQILRIVDAGRLSPFGKSVIATPKITNLPK